jgi:hypothetical protein
MNMYLTSPCQHATPARRSVVMFALPYPTFPVLEVVLFTVVYLVAATTALSAGTSQASRPPYLLP